MNPESVRPSGRNGELPPSPLKVLTLSTLLVCLSVPIGFKLREIKRYFDIQKTPSLLIGTQKMDWYIVKVSGVVDFDNERGMILNVEFPGVKEPPMYLVTIPQSTTNALCTLKEGERVCIQIIRTPDGISIGSEVRPVKPGDPKLPPNNQPQPPPPEERPTKRSPVYRGSDPGSVA